MIRLLLSRYNLVECTKLYNALHQSLMVLDANSKAKRDIETATDYLTGYMDCLQEKQKEGAKQCPHG